MNTKKPIINFILQDKRWVKLVPSWKKEVAFAFERIARILKKDFSGLEVSVVLTDDIEIQRLNKNFRHKDKPTNVLSFPSEEKEELGDVILAYETVQKEALEMKILPSHHTLHLITHGFLHLLGYDHEKDEDAQKMENLEIRILKDLNIANPYEER